MFSILPPSHPISGAFEILLVLIFCKDCQLVVSMEEMNLVITSFRKQHCTASDLTSYLNSSLFCLSHYTRVRSHCICRLPIVCNILNGSDAAKERTWFHSFPKQLCIYKRVLPLLTGCNIPNGSGPQRTESGFILYI